MEKELSIALFAIVIADRLWMFIKDRFMADKREQREDLAELKKELKECTKANIINTEAIKNLTTELNKHSRVLLDLNEAHTKLRAMDERLKNLEN